MAVVGYIALSMTAVDAAAAPEPLRHRAPNPIPALLIGRLAVDRSVQGMGVRTALVVHALATAVELQEKAAFRAVIVDAASAAASQWWARFGFEPMARTDQRPFLPSKDIAKTLDALSRKRPFDVVGLRR
jgi:predicted N-acetyltransferase YhbS